MAADFHALVNALCDEYVKAQQQMTAARNWNSNLLFQRRSFNLQPFNRVRSAFFYLNLSFFFASVHLLLAARPNSHCWRKTYDSIIYFTDVIKRFFLAITGRAAGAVIECSVDIFLHFSAMNAFLISFLSSVIVIQTESSPTGGTRATYQTVAKCE
jgi:hypothetical protein